MKPPQPPGNDPPSGAFVPPEPWIDAFDSQCTEQLLKRARRVAAQRARDFGWDSPANDTYYAKELVQNVLTDTLLGVLRWDPNAETLEAHLFDEIRLRAWRDAKRAQRLPHASIDTVNEGGESPVLSELEEHLRANAPEAPVATVARAAETTAALRALAQDKPLVIRILDAFSAGATRKEDVMCAVEISSSQYHNGRRQLARLVEQLPDSLRPRRRSPGV
ncbi:MAG TPA: hypothetical protein VFT22_01245 [Kofleriaceae bacterium]|nr:hypothetical protein [Kofleriaceae bacterium]